jgi:hypothetical protein
MRRDRAATLPLQALLDTLEESFRLSHSCLGEMESAMGSGF